jgi:predicted nucleotidyltransferase
MAQTVPVKTKKLVEEKREAIKRIAQGHGAFNVRLFGSVVREEDRLDSDVDLLVDVGPTTSSWFPAGLILDLEDLLGRKVEIVTERALNPHLREHVLAEAIEL